ncbi:MFS transporter [Pseudonocardia charpentierae]|uniref:MFS transporter n=1 Tax=Pseudonocardia charpentierae TaxID=3075545 RepID=A0ABU2N6S6_9PSEU|nr:MFS transporter [Pseudonocardia sp. DSM 45834]MDT0349638.1 MFS transporter [Pseudonocardia sp. DSM 45834]
MTQTAAPAPTTRRIHPAWWAAAATFLALLGAAAFRATPSVMIEPLRAEFGWSIGTISAALSVNLALFGITAPFAAALMERFGVRRVVSIALLMVATGSGLTVFMTASWQLVMLWGVIVGLGTGSMAMALVATVVGRWFVARRGLVSGILTAASATGQLIFLPTIARIVLADGWRAASLTISVCALAVIPVVLLFLRERPADLGELPYGGTPADVVPPMRTGAARLAVGTLAHAARVRTFWLLAGGFFVCGATTTGLVQQHFMPAAHDHGMPVTTAATLLALVGVFDLVGTIGSGWLTDRFDPRILLGAYYGLRGVSLALLVPLFGADLNASVLAFVIFYGLDWVATVPPTLALTREAFGAASPIVFGWIFASHQLGAACAALVAGITRDALGSYDAAWYGGAVLCVVGAALSLSIRRNRPVALVAPLA